jgi:hypothetical protein|tara:strand:- start:15515 stop:16381 length:867 start_codon:yes stop_codon:yes gene_type:complete
MVNDLQTFQSLSKEEIMKMTGQDDGSEMSAGILPKLSISRQAEDEEGNTLRPGVYSTYYPDIEAKVYSLKEKDKPVHFRPFIRGYQYMKYDADTNSYPSTSIIFKSWKEEAIDSTGGVRCGRIIGKSKDELTPAEAEAQRSARCYILVYGLVTMDATTADGSPVKVENMPILWRSAGSSFRPVSEAIQGLKGKDKLMQNHVLHLNTPLRKTAGSNVYYVPSISISNEEVQFTKDDLEHMEMFQSRIKDENDAIFAKWKEAQDKKSSDGETAKVINEIEESPENILAAG